MKSWWLVVVKDNSLGKQNKIQYTNNFHPNKNGKKTMNMKDSAFYRVWIVAGILEILRGSNSKKVIIAEKCLRQVKVNLLSSIKISTSSSLEIQKIKPLI